jgi:CRISPR system Cascade subunit CasA
MDPNNLLTDGVFRATIPGSGVQLLNLSQLLAALGKDEIENLPGLQCHQEDIFHIFLCYLAGVILTRDGDDKVTQDESFWHDGIVKLSPDKADSGWSLVVDDVSLPGFMQPPILLNDAKKLKLKAHSPDELDVLQTAKNHDVKGQRAHSTRVEDWVYSLVNLQTSIGFVGQGNYGIARMNGGFGSRPCVELLYELSPGGRFQRDVSKLISMRSTLLRGDWPYVKNGIVLTWMEPWDGRSSLSPKDLDPYFIEIARIVRLYKQGDKYLAKGMSSQAVRIYSKDFKGVVGDAWTPIKNKANERSSLTVPKPGITPKLLRELIFEDSYTPAGMQEPDSRFANRSCVFHASVLVRGQGTTDGYFSRDLPIPASVTRALFSNGTPRRSLQELSKTGINDAGTMESKVLGPSLYSLLEAGPEQINFDKQEVRMWTTTAKKKFSDAWGDAFFPWLWSTVEKVDQTGARLEWLAQLKDIALKTFDEAVSSLPKKSARTYRARARAEAVFFGSLKKHFSELRWR